MMRRYERPDSIDDVLRLLPTEHWSLLAGGTDIYPAATEAFGWGQPAQNHILDLTGIPFLDAVEETATTFRIGCLVTWSTFIEANLPHWFECLRLAGREIGSAQIQNRGTLVGNICNASPAADGVPALLVLDALVELRSAKATRELPLADFIRGNRRTDCQADELVTAIIIPKRDTMTVSTFSKLGARRYLVISIAMVSALIETDSTGRIVHARVAVGACSEVAQRLPALEAALIGRAISDPIAAQVNAEIVSVLTPIGDLRGSATYRRQAASTLISRTLASLQSSFGMMT